MSNKIPCYVVRDLLPLYEDEVCAPETGKLVEEHLFYCDDCMAELRNLKKRPAAKASAESVSLADALKTLNKSIRFKHIRNAVLAVILAIVLIFGSIALHSHLFLTSQIEMPASELSEARLSVTEGGKILFHITPGDRSNSTGRSMGAVREGTEEVLYVTVLRPILEWPGGVDKDMPDDFDMYLLEDGKVYWLDNPYGGELRHYFDDRGVLYAWDYWDEMYIPADPITRIYAGTSDDRVLLWEEGMEIEKASATLDFWFTPRADEYGDNGGSWDSPLPTALPPPNAATGPLDEWAPELDDSESEGLDSIPPPAPDDLSSSLELPIGE